MRLLALLAALLFTSSAFAGYEFVMSDGTKIASDSNDCSSVAVAWAKKKNPDGLDYYEKVLGLGAPSGNCGGAKKIDGPVKVDVVLGGSFLFLSGSVSKVSKAPVKMDPFTDMIQFGTVVALILLFSTLLASVYVAVKAALLLLALIKR